MELFVLLFLVLWYPCYRLVKRWLTVDNESSRDGGS